MKHARNSKQEQSTPGQRWEEVFGTIACVTVQEWVAQSWSVAELQEARAAPYLFQSSRLTKWNTSTEHHDDTWKSTETFGGAEMNRMLQAQNLLWAVASGWMKRAGLRWFAFLLLTYRELFIVIATNSWCRWNGEKW